MRLPWFPLLSDNLGPGNNCWTSTRSWGRPVVGWTYLKPLVPVAFMPHPSTYLLPQLSGHHCLEFLLLHHHSVLATRLLRFCELQGGFVTVDCAPGHILSTVGAGFHPDPSLAQVQEWSLQWRGIGRYPINFPYLGGLWVVSLRKTNMVVPVVCGRMQIAQLAATQTGGWSAGRSTRTWGGWRDLSCGWNCTLLPLRGVAHQDVLSRRTGLRGKCSLNRLWASTHFSFASLTSEPCFTPPHTRQIMLCQLFA